MTRFSPLFIRKVLATGKAEITPLKRHFSFKEVTTSDSLYDNNSAILTVSSFYISLFAVSEWENSYLHPDLKCLTAEFVTVCQCRGS